MPPLQCLTSLLSRVCVVIVFVCLQRSSVSVQNLSTLSLWQSHRQSRRLRQTARRLSRVLLLFPLPVRLHSCRRNDTCSCRQNVQIRLLQIFLRLSISTHACLELLRCNRVIAVKQVTAPHTRRINVCVSLPVDYVIDIQVFIYLTS